MAEDLEKTLFERALLASRLVDAAELVQVAQALPTGPGGADATSDAILARRLVERELLNEWQVEQLRAGRTKFTLGPYLIVDAIGKGGMGHVFQGRHELLGRIEAIKVLPKSKSTPQAIANFQHEIRAQAQLDHPNLVRVSYADKDGDTYFLVTEFVPGVDLRRLVRRLGALPPDQAAAVVSQAAEALDYAHRRGLVHRDVKPGNLLLRPDGRVKVTDLGLAWYLDDTFGAAPTGEGKIVGTCDYIAPESIEEPDKIIPVSDIYSLGCTLYYALTGKVPYPGGNPKEKMRRHQEDEPIDPKAFNPSLPDGLNGLVKEMMRKDHRERTPSASAVIDRLQPYIAEDSREGVAELVTNCDRGGSPRISSGARPVPGTPDIGETLESLTDDALDSPTGGYDEAHGQASQATDPIAEDEQETVPTPGRAPGLPGTGNRGVEPQVPAGEAVSPGADRWVRLTVGLAIAATAAILIASFLRYL